MATGCGPRNLLGGHVLGLVDVRPSLLSQPRRRCSSDHREISVMVLSALSVACLFLLGADPPPASPLLEGPLPRSSIAAVLSHRGELGLSEAEVSELEKRDEALQEQLADIREQSAAGPSRRGDGAGRSGSRSSPSSDGTAQPSSPIAAAQPEGTSGGGRRGGGWGGGRRNAGKRAPDARDQTARTASLQSKLDDADTAAWLSAEAVLGESRREKAREVAERYREQLADRREAARGGGSAPPRTTGK